MLIENKDEEQSNLLLIAACFNAATELDKMWLDAQKVVESLPAIVRLLEYHAKESSQTIKDIGGCDHSVGICCCELIRETEAAHNLINSLKLDQKGGK